MDQICLKAHGKVNLTLDIVGRRADGYHLLNSVMQSISLADRVLVTKESQGIAVKSDHPHLPLDETNSCWRAAAAFFSFTGVQGGAVIELHKAIPLAAGLGGGSADAAAVLHALNRLYQTDLDLAELQVIGLKVGADVPFCLAGGTCLVQGIGEKVTALPPFPQVQLVLVKPETGVSTAEVYRRLSPAAHGSTSTARLTALLEEGQGAAVLAGTFHNALEMVTEALVPEVSLWKERLLAQGAHCALMSGSGPTVFGLFTEEGQARSFQAAYRGEAQIFTAGLEYSGVEEMNGGDRQ